MGVIFLEYALRPEVRSRDEPEATALHSMLARLVTLVLASFRLSFVINFPSSLGDINLENTRKFCTKIKTKRHRLLE